MYDIIFNDITTEALKKFIKVSGNKTIKQTLPKNDLIAEVKKLLGEDQEFHNSFKGFFKDIEKAGRKDFWFADVNVKVTAQELHGIRTRFENIEKEDDTIYIPANEQDVKYFNLGSNSDIFEIKVVRKKIVKEQDTARNRTEGDYLYVAYRIKEIRHVSYYKLDLTRNTLLMGVDVWQNLGTKEKLKEVQKDIEHIFGAGFWDKVGFIDMKEKASKLLREYDYIITKELKEQVSNTPQGAVFNIETGRVNTIRKDLNDGTVKLNEIKTKYIDDDVRNNKVFQAAEGKNIDLTTKGGIGVLFYTSSVTGEYEYFKFEVHATEARIKFSNDHTTLQELDNVFSKIN